MGWEVRFFANGRTLSEAACNGSSPFRTEADALTHARFLLDDLPDGRVEVFDRNTSRHAVYRLRQGRMLALAEAA